MMNVTPLPGYRAHDRLLINSKRENHSDNNSFDEIKSCFCHTRERQWKSLDLFL